MPSTNDIVTIEDFFEQVKGYLNEAQIDYVRKAYILAAAIRSYMPISLAKILQCALP